LAHFQQITTANIGVIMEQIINQPKFCETWIFDKKKFGRNSCRLILLVLWCVSDRQFEKHGSSTAANNDGEATSGQVVSDNEDDSFLSKLTSLKRKIFG